MQLKLINFFPQVNNFGLNLIFGLTPSWNHVEDPLPPLHINALLERFRKDIKNPSFLTDKVMLLTPLLINQSIVDTNKDWERVKSRP